MPLTSIAKVLTVCLATIMVGVVVTPAQVAGDPLSIKSAEWLQTPLVQLHRSPLPDGWAKVVDQRAQISVSMPGEPSIQTTEKDGVQVTVYVYRTDFGGYILTVGDIRHKNVDQNEMLAGLESGLLLEASSYSPNAKATPIARFREVRYIGRELFLEVGDLTFYKHYFVSRKGHAVTLSVASRRTLDYAATVRPYLDSLAILSKRS